MILHLTLGGTHIPIEIDVGGDEPRLSVLQGQVITLPSVPSPHARKRAVMPKLTLVGVVLLSGLTAYQVYASRRGAPLALPEPARAEVSRNGAGPASVDPAQIPLQLRRELAGKPVVTPTAPAEVGLEPVGGNPFGLD